MTAPRLLRGLRGATTCADNSTHAIHEAVTELVDALMDQNALDPDQLVSVTFSVTADLDASFPAATARHRSGWEEVALLDVQQMAVQGDLARCIRLLAHAWLPYDRSLHHPYLRGASRLRPDRSSHN
ncbi:chorismate mutase [Synechococcus sp. UW179A]|uniref:chorismate mutase n=1 Tax=Synechococcus sp. UW179A TaxID=2575510 RepID=UPI000E0F2354|nr:chorismate mutase [Synechococcus sp. UW179A]